MKKLAISVEYALRPGKTTATTTNQHAREENQHV